MASTTHAEAANTSGAARECDFFSGSSDVDQLASPSISALQTPKHAQSGDMPQSKTLASDLSTPVSSPTPSPSIHKSSPPPPAQKDVKSQHRGLPPSSSDSHPRSVSSAASSAGLQQPFSGPRSVFKAQRKKTPLDLKHTKRDHFSARHSSFGNIARLTPSATYHALKMSTPITQHAAHLHPSKVSPGKSTAPGQAQEQDPPAKQPPCITIGPHGALSFHDMAEAEQEEVLQCSIAAANAGDDDMEEEFRLPQAAPRRGDLSRLPSPSPSPETPPARPAPHQACTTTCLTCAQSPRRPSTSQAQEMVQRQSGSIPMNGVAGSPSADSSSSQLSPIASSGAMRLLEMLEETHRPDPPLKKRRLESMAKRFSASRSKTGPASARQRASTVGPIAQGTPTTSAAIQTAPTSLEPLLGFASQESPAHLFSILADVSNRASAKSLAQEKELVDTRQLVEAQQQQIEKQNSEIEFLRNRVAWWERKGWDSSLAKSASHSESSEAAIESDPGGMTSFL